MPRTDTRPTIPTDQDALQAREASRAIENLHADEDQLLLQLAKAGEVVTTVRLPAAAARLLMQMLAEMGKGRLRARSPPSRRLTGSMVRALTSSASSTRGSCRSARSAISVGCRWPMSSNTRIAPAPTGSKRCVN